MKLCGFCSVEKEVSEFNRKGDKLQAFCRECSKTISRAHYRANKQKYLDRAKAREKKIKAEIDALKSKPCADCGGTFNPWQMDFDHLGDKEFIISAAPKMATNHEILLKEIAKCDLVCSNCHRNRTHFRSTSNGG